MYDSLIEGKRYKVRLKPKEELEELVEKYFFQEVWLKEYMDGQVGVLHYDSMGAECRTYEVLWEDTQWYYRLEWLKILGEV